MSISKKYRYKIVLSAPIGDKEGFLTAEISNNKIEGKLTVMNRSNYFYGKIKDDGICEITGSISTLMRVINYRGNGSIDENNLSFLLETGCQKMILTGKILNIGDDEI